MTSAAFEKLHDHHKGTRYVEVPVRYQVTDVFIQDESYMVSVLIRFPDEHEFKDPHVCMRLSSPLDLASGSASLERGVKSAVALMATGYVLPRHPTELCPLCFVGKIVLYNNEGLCRVCGVSRERDRQRND